MTNRNSLSFVLLFSFLLGLVGCKFQPLGSRAKNSNQPVGSIFSLGEVTQDDELSLVLKLSDEEKEKNRISKQNREVLFESIKMALRTTIHRHNGNRNGPLNELAKLPPLRHSLFFLMTRYKLWRARVPPVSSDRPNPDGSGRPFIVAHITSGQIRADQGYSFEYQLDRLPTGDLNLTMSSHAVERPGPQLLAEPTSASDEQLLQATDSRLVLDFLEEQFVKGRKRNAAFGRIVSGDAAYQFKLKVDTRDFQVVSFDQLLHLVHQAMGKFDAKRKPVTEAESASFAKALKQFALNRLHFQVALQLYQEFAGPRAGKSMTLKENVALRELFVSCVRRNDQGSEDLSGLVSFCVNNREPLIEIPEEERLKPDSAQERAHKPSTPEVVEQLRRELAEHVRVHVHQLNIKEVNTTTWGTLSLSEVAPDHSPRYRDIVLGMHAKIVATAQTQSLPNGRFELRFDNPRLFLKSRSGGAAVEFDMDVVSENQVPLIAKDSLQDFVKEFRKNLEASFE